jgi:microcystin-dependent protein
MAQPYVGEIRMFAGNFAPAGWMMCEGQLLPISENETLFQLIGTTYGGDGESTFGLPDLRGRVPVHIGGVSNFVLGEPGGVEEVTVSSQTMPIHSHPFTAAQNPASVASPSGTVPAESPQINMYIADSPSAFLASSAITTVGGSQPHTNFQPYLCLNFIISLFGIFPSPT